MIPAMRLGDSRLELIDVRWGFGKLSVVTRERTRFGYCRNKTRSTQCVDSLYWVI